jgi:hypothetical protein
MSGRPDALPNLSDPATLGCLLALVREKHGDRCVALWYDMGDNPLHWELERPDGDGDWISQGASGAEALVKALEAVL